MKRIISLFQNILLRQIVIVFLIGAVFFTIEAFNYNHAVQAQVTPEEYSERVQTLDRERFGEDKNPLGKAKTSFKGTVENVKEKLNLDEPVPQSTKDFLNSVQQKAEDTVEPLTRTEHGYYQDNILAK
jgi:hypothetical protein